MRSTALALLLGGTCVVATACGSTTDGATVAGTPPVSGLETVAEDYGRALILGDTPALVDLIDPRLTSALTAQDRAALDALGPSGDGVELHDFSVEVVRQDPTSAEVVYAGERCAPTLSYESPETTLSGGKPDAPTTVGVGSIVAGEVECIDIGASSKAPVRFVQVDGRWYGTLPSF